MNIAGTLIEYSSITIGNLKLSAISNHVYLYVTCITYAATLIETPVSIVKVLL